jgi:hypothetical protein
MWKRLRIIQSRAEQENAEVGEEDTVTWQSDYRRGLDWWSDLLHTYRWKLQVITTISLIHALVFSLEHITEVFSVCLH